MSNHDKRFMDLFSLTIGALVAIAVALMILALMVGSKSQMASLREDPKFAEQVNERLKPFGRVVVTGEVTEEPQDAQVAAPAAVAAPLSGPQVFNQACNACHGAGIGGAPRSGDKAVWVARIAQGTSTLYKHALEGFQGKAGYMPPKGGYVNLSDTEIRDAVDYMVAQSR